MLNETSKAKVKRFVSDVAMYEAVSYLLRESFDKPREGADVNVLAAQTIARECLKDALKELKRYANKDVENKKLPPNVGL